MNTNKKAKWIVGITGIAFSAFVIGQLDNTPPEDPNLTVAAVEINESMSKREKELVQLDWSNFSIQVNDYQGADRSDRSSRRS